MLTSKKPVIWHSADELKNKFNKTSTRFNRLNILESVWQVLVGKKAKFWVLQGVGFDSKNKSAYIEVEVKNSAARHDLTVSSAKLLEDINKYFDKPWLTKIVIK